MEFRIGQDVAMATYVGFLRAINLGATRKFPKAAIVRAVEQAGFGDVETYINTGNVRFATTMRSRARIEDALERAFAAEAGFDVPTIVFSPAELRQIAADAERFAAGHEGRHYVSLLKQDPTPEQVEAIEAARPSGEVARVGGRAVHLLLGPNYHQATLTNAVVEKHLGVSTNRNLNVIKTLADKWGG